MPDERYDPLACVVPLHIYLIYWPWSKLEGWNLKSNLKSMCNLILGIHSRGSVGYVPSSILYLRYSTHSDTILGMVLMRVSGCCTVLMVLLTRAQNNVSYIAVLVQCMVLMVSISTCVQYTMRGSESRAII